MNKESYHLGAVVSMTVYMLEAIVSIIAELKLRRITNGQILLFTIYWLVTAGIVYYLETRKRLEAVWICAISVALSSIMSLGICFIFHNSYLIFFAFFLQWVESILFLETSICIWVYVIDLITLLVITLLPPDIFWFHYGPIELIAALLVFTGGTIIAIRLVKMIQFQTTKGIQQEQSLDDMLRVIEAKCDSAREANKAKSDFLANMSHEIRTPINAILGFDTMILRESREPDVRSYATDIRNEGELLLSLINDILDFSKIESGKLNILKN